MMISSPVFNFADAADDDDVSAYDINGDDDDDDSPVSNQPYRCVGRPSTSSLPLLQSMTYCEQIQIQIQITANTNTNNCKYKYKYNYK